MAARPPTVDVQRKGSVSAPRPKARAIKDFKGKPPKELTFNANDILVISEADDNNWAFGTHIESGKDGWFPMDHVEIVDAGGDTNTAGMLGVRLVSSPRIESKSIRNDSETQRKLTRALSSRSTAKDLAERNILKRTMSGRDFTAPIDRKSLEQSLQQRPSKKDLKEMHIYPNTDAAPRLTAAAVELEKRKRQDGLSGFIKRKVAGVFRKSTLNATSQLSLSDNVLLEAAEDKKKKAKKPKQPRVQNEFGLSAQDIYTKFDRMVPYVMQTCIEYIEKNGLDCEGIFRISANHAAIAELRKAFEKGSVQPNKMTNPHVVAGVLKMFLRGMSEPLATFELYDTFLKANDVDDDAARLAYLRSTVDMLPTANRASLEYLMKFLHVVVQHTATNRMDGEALAVCLAPSLMNPHVGTMEDMWKVRAQCNIIRDMIVHYPTVFEKRTSSSAALPAVSDGATENTEKREKTESTDVSANSQMRSASASVATPEEEISAVPTDDNPNPPVLSWSTDCPPHSTSPSSSPTNEHAAATKAKPPVPARTRRPSLKISDADAAAATAASTPRPPSVSSLVSRTTAPTPAVINVDTPIAIESMFTLRQLYFNGALRLEEYNERKKMLLNAAKIGDVAGVLSTSTAKLDELLKTPVSASSRTPVADAASGSVNAAPKKEKPPRPPRVRTVKPVTPVTDGSAAATAESTSESDTVLLRSVCSMEDSLQFGKDQFKHRRRSVSQPALPIWLRKH